MTHFIKIVVGFVYQLCNIKAMNQFMENKKKTKKKKNYKTHKEKK